MDSELKLACAGAVLAVLIGVLVVHETDEWEAFKVEHHCVKSGEQSGSNTIGYAVGSNGQGAFVSTYTSGKTGYQCDDGVTYWR